MTTTITIAINDNININGNNNDDNNTGPQLYHRNNKIKSTRVSLLLCREPINQSERGSFRWITRGTRPSRSWPKRTTSCGGEGCQTTSPWWLCALSTKPTQPLRYVDGMFVVVVAVTAQGAITLLLGYCCVVNTGLYMFFLYLFYFLCRLSFFCSVVSIIQQ